MLTLVAVPWIAVRLPHDYFQSTKRRSPKPIGAFQRATYFSLLIAKNLLGAIFLTLGVGMLVLPGQGLITILVGLSLMNFPGKFQLQQSLVSIPVVLGTLNWLRERYGTRPLQIVGDRGRTNQRELDDLRTTGSEYD